MRPSPPQAEAFQPSLQVAEQLGKRAPHRSRAGNQYVIMPWYGVKGHHCRNRRLQPSPRAIAIDRDADLAAGGKANAGRRCGGKGARCRLQNETRRYPPLAVIRDTEEFCAPLKARQCCHAQADKRLRPLARRRDSTMRPPVLAMRFKKPWRRLRTSLLG
jgi:hypothetical protein